MMEKFIGCKVVEAEEMTAGEAIEKGYLRLNENENVDKTVLGYHVHYTDNDYDSWSPKKVFEDNYALINNLNITAKQMLSKDYKERFIAEFNQVQERFIRLKKMVLSWDSGTLEFIPTCPRDIYNDQLNYMMNYIYILVKRAKIEEVDITIDDYIADILENI